VAGLEIGTFYEGAVKDLVWKLKFYHSRAAADALAAVLMRRLRERHFDVITAVPIAPSRHRERGYNQAELIARRVAAELGLPYRSLLLRFGARHQTGQRRNDRLSQVKGVFELKRSLHGETVLVVDDVITTGATLAECAVVLRQAGAGEVWGAAVARGE